MPLRNLTRRIRVMRGVAVLVALGVLTLATSSAAARRGGGNIPPTANAGGPYIGNVGHLVQLDGSGSSDPDGPTRKLRYAWTFGDGAASTSVSPSHVYAASGVYTVTLTVTDAKGAQGTASTTATKGRLRKKARSMNGERTRDSMATNAARNRTPATSVPTE